VKKTLLCVCFLVLCNLALLAQTGKGPQAVHFPKKSAIHVPPQETPAQMKKIYSNLGTKLDLYSTEEAYQVSGPNSPWGVRSLAIPFIPKVNSHVSQVGIAVQYVSGANQVNVSIYGDSGGAPGTVLAGPVTVTNVPPLGQCCLLTVANFTAIAITGGTQYWVVADAPPSGTGSDFEGLWFLSVKNFPQAINSGSGWLTYNALAEFACEVLGTIP
jgi:hypothetical protein